MTARDAFVTGGTGYLGSRLILRLLARGHAVRAAEGEALIRTSGLDATILRPWYVLGPGHRWPYLLLPAYWLLERVPATREGARRLGLVTVQQMVRALCDAVERPCTGRRTVTVEEIRRTAYA